MCALCSWYVLLVEECTHWGEDGVLFWGIVGFSDNNNVSGGCGDVPAQTEVQVTMVWLVVANREPFSLVLPFLVLFSPCPLHTVLLTWATQHNMIFLDITTLHALSYAFNSLLKYTKSAMWLTKDGQQRTQHQDHPRNQTNGQLSVNTNNAMFIFGLWEETGAHIWGKKYIQ